MVVTHFFSSKHKTEKEADEEVKELNRTSGHILHAYRVGNRVYYFKRKKMQHKKEENRLLMNKKLNDDIFGDVF